MYLRLITFLIPTIIFKTVSVALIFAALRVYGLLLYFVVLAAAWVVTMLAVTRKCDEVCALGVLFFLPMNIFSVVFYYDNEDDTDKIF